MRTTLFTALVISVLSIQASAQTKPAPNPTQNQKPAAAAGAEPDPCGTVAQECKASKGRLADCLLLLPKLPQGCKPVSYKTCDQDSKAYCASFQGVGKAKELDSCLRQNIAKVSADCKKAIEFVDYYKKYPKK